MSGSVPFIAPPDYLELKFNLTVAPDAAEIGLGWTCLALYAAFLVVAAVLWYLEAVHSRSSASGASSVASHNTTGGRSRSAGSVTTFVSPFFVLIIAFCALRIVCIAIMLAVPNLYQNMLASFAVQSFGNVAFVAAFTMVALSWTRVLYRAGMLEKLMEVVRIALWVGLAVVTLLLMAFNVWYCVTLKDKFGRAAHDGTVVGPYGPNGTLARIPLVPVNGSLQKGQTGIIMENYDVHVSLMGERGTYSAYCFLIGAVFGVLSASIITSVLRTQRLVRSDKDNTVLRVVVAILAVSVPVALAFSVMFIFTIVEIVMHRHGSRFELYISNFVMELFSVAILLIHYSRANLRAYNRRRAQDAKSREMSKVVSSDVVSGNTHASDVEDDPVDPGSYDPVGEFVSPDVAANWDACHVDL